MAKHSKPVLRLRIRGSAVGSGRIPVPDLVRICQETQAAVKKQAEAIEGKKTLHPGPVATTILEECTLELIGIKKGSTTLEFAFAKPQLRIAGMEAEALGAQAISEVAASIKSLGNGNRKDIDPGVLRSLYGLSGIVEGRLISEIDWIIPALGRGKPSVIGLVNITVRDRAAHRLSSPRYIRAQIDGTLDMVDFKPEDHKCRIDPAIGSPIFCRFTPGLADRVQQLLRTTVRATGIAKLASHKDKIDLLEVEAISPLPSLTSGQEHFFQNSDIARLAEMQRIKPLDHPEKLAGAIPSDVDIDELLEEIYAARK